MLGRFRSEVKQIKSPDCGKWSGLNFLMEVDFMPATKFICPNGQRIRITDCLSSCPNQQRCMFLPTLRAIAKSLDRKITEPTVTELISGVRETYLKKTSAYAVEPSTVLYALQLKDNITSGQFDLFGKILDTDEGVLGDLKITSSFKLMRALGIYKVKVDTGEVYKSGLKKGQPKFRTELRYDGVRELLDWSIQLNYYRLLLERAGFKISRMYIQALCRDASLRIATERGIDKPVYIIPINKISDHWLNRYFQHKAKILREAIASKTLPPVCSFRERWGNRKCLGYCAARENCPYAQRLLSQNKEVNADDFLLSA